MNEDEIKDYIHDMIYKILDDYEINQKEIIGTMRREIEEDYLPAFKGYKYRMDEIQNLVIQQSVRVNNVFFEFKKMSERYVKLNKKENFTKEVDKLINMYNEIKLLQNSIRVYFENLENEKNSMDKLNKILDILNESNYRYCEG